MGILKKKTFEGDHQSIILVSPNPKDKIRETMVSNSIRKVAPNLLETVREGFDYQSKQSNLKLEIQTNAKEHSTGGSSSTKIYNKNETKVLKQGSNYSEMSKYFNGTPNQNGSILDFRALDSQRDSEQNHRPQSERLQYYFSSSDSPNVDRRVVTQGETLKVESVTKNPKSIIKEELFIPKLDLKKPNDYGMPSKGKMHKRGNLHEN